MIWNTYKTIFRVYQDYKYIYQESQWPEKQPVSHLCFAVCSLKPHFINFNSHMNKG